MLRAFSSILIVLVLSHFGVGQQLPTSPSQIKIPPLRPFAPEQPKRIQLPNGAVLFLIEDHEIPLIDFTAEFRGGSRDEPADKIGLSAMFGDVWRTGGTTAKTGDQVDDLLETRAAKLETGGGLESTTISGNCLKQDFDTVFALMLEFIQSPALREEKIELAKKEFDTAISRRNDNASAIAAREAVRIAYGKSNPYARIAEYSTIAAIKRQDLLDWKKKYVVAGNMIFGITGDFDAAQMERKLRTAFAGLPSGPKYVPRKVSFTDPAPGIYFVEKSDVNQSQIQMVALGTERNNPDYFPITVMNEAFGTGGFSSRLLARIRSRQGLTYSVSGAYGAGWDHPGLFRISTSTKSATTGEIIKALYSEVDNASKEPFTKDEVQHAIDSVLNQFVFNYDSRDKVLRQSMLLEFYGYPADWLKRYHDAVAKMTVDDVNRVARKYLDRSKLATLVVGNQHDFDPAWSSLGPITPVDITIPEPTQNAATAPIVPTNEGKALAMKVLSYVGGPDKLTTVHSVSYTQNIELLASGVTMVAHSAAVFPDRVRQTISTPQGEMTTVISPAGSAMSLGPQTRVIPTSQANEYLAGLKRSPFYIASHLSDYTFALNGTRQVNAASAQVLAIHGGGQDFLWFVDPATGKILGSEYKGSGQSGPVTRTEIYVSEQTISGFKVPENVDFSEDGKQSVKVRLQDYKVNPQLDAALFNPPAPSATEPPK